jgi:hypothetical protein
VCVQVIMQVHVILCVCVAVYVIFTHVHTYALGDMIYAFSLSTIL